VKNIEYALNIFWWILFLSSIFAVSIVISEGFMRLLTGSPVLDGVWIVWLAQHVWEFVILLTVCAIYKIVQLYRWTA
jgi:hypothetical protein